MSERRYRDGIGTKWMEEGERDSPNLVYGRVDGEFELVIHSWFDKLAPPTEQQLKHRHDSERLVGDNRVYYSLWRIRIGVIRHLRLPFFTAAIFTTRKCIARSCMRAPTILAQDLGRQRLSISRSCPMAVLVDRPQSTESIATLSLADRRFSLQAQ